MLAAVVLHFLLLEGLACAANQEASPFPYDLLRHLLAKDSRGCLRRSACLLADFNKTTPGIFRDSADVGSWTLPSRLSGSKPDARGIIVLQCGPGLLRFHADGPWTRLLQVHFQGSRLPRWVDYIRNPPQQPRTPGPREQSKRTKTKARLRPEKSNRTRRQSGLALPHVDSEPDQDSSSAWTRSGTTDRVEVPDAEVSHQMALQFKPSRELNGSTSTLRGDIVTEEYGPKITSGNAGFRLVLPAYEGTLERPMPNNNVGKVPYGTQTVESRLAASRLEELTQEESSHHLPQEDSSNLLPQEESSNLLPQEESSHLLPQEESSHLLPQEESSHIFPQKESSHLLPQEDLGKEPELANTHVDTITAQTSQNFPWMTHEEREGQLVKSQPNFNHQASEEESYQLVNQTRQQYSLPVRRPRQVSGEMEAQGAFVVTARPNPPVGFGVDRPSPEEAFFMAEGRDIDVVVVKPPTDIGLAGLEGFRLAYRLGLGVQGPRDCRKAYPDCRYRDGLLLDFALELFY